MNARDEVMPDFVIVSAPFHKGDKYKVYWFEYGGLKKARYDGKTCDPNGIRAFAKSEDAVKFGKKRAEAGYASNGTRYISYDSSGKLIESKIVKNWRLVDYNEGVKKK
jgi:hypothetical protein